MKRTVVLPGQHLDSIRGVRVHGEYRYLPVPADERQGESCVVLQLAREGRRGAVMALVEFADQQQQVVGSEWLRGLRDRGRFAPETGW